VEIPPLSKRHGINEKKLINGGLTGIEI